MSQAVVTLKSRGNQYGPVESSFDRISQLATIILNKQITPYDVTMILTALKLSRMQDDRANADHYVDGINYMAFGAQFAGILDPADTSVEDEISAMARRLAPLTSDEGDSKG